MVSIGLDAAVVASHQVAIRGPGLAVDFRVPPTLAGLEELMVRLSDWAPAVVVAEPIAGTKAAVATRHHRVGLPSWVRGQPALARLRQAIAGANKTEVIDADMLARSEAILGVDQAKIPPAGQIGLRRAMRLPYSAWEEFDEWPGDH